MFNYSPADEALKVLEFTRQLHELEDYQTEKAKRELKDRQLKASLDALQCAEDLIGFLWNNIANQRIYIEYQKAQTLMEKWQESLKDITRA